MSINPLIEPLYLSQVLKQNPLAIDPAYLAFRPNLLSSLAKAFAPLLSPLHYDFLYPTDLVSSPLATHLSLLYNIPLHLSDSTNSFIQPGQTALLLDVSSLLFHSCAMKLKNLGFFVTDALTLLGETSKTHKEKEITLHNLLDIKIAENDLNTLLDQNSYSKIH